MRTGDVIGVTNVTLLLTSWCRCWVHSRSRSSINAGCS